MKKCGIILFNEKEQKYFLVYGRKSNKWGFPKGHMEEGETEKETALREFYEETGFELKNQNLNNRFQIKNNIYFQISISHPNELIQKTTIIPDSNEILKVAWLSFVDILALDIENCNFGLKFWMKKMKNNNVKNFCFSLGMNNMSKNYQVNDKKYQVNDKKYQVNEKNYQVNAVFQPN